MPLMGVGVILGLFEFFKTITTGGGGVTLTAFLAPRLYNKISFLFIFNLLYQFIGKINNLCLNSKSQV